MIEIEKDRFCISIEGNHFLYKMVRNIVGTLIDIGRIKILLVELPNNLQSRSRSSAGITAPPPGLFLHEVFYETASVSRVLKKFMPTY